MTRTILFGASPSPCLSFTLPHKQTHDELYYSFQLSRQRQDRGDHWRRRWYVHYDPVLKSQRSPISRHTGIGLAYVRIALGKGAKVIIADLQLHKDAEDLAGKPNVVFTKCDVAKWADLENLITVSKDTFGAVPDVYVANAGVFEPVLSPLPPVQVAAHDQSFL